MRLIPFFLIFILMVQPAVAAESEMIFDTLNSYKDTFVSFFTNVINSVKNGLTNVMDAVKGYISSLIPDIPSLTDIKNYVLSFLPVWAQSWDAMKMKIDGYVHVPSMSDIWTYVKDKIDSTYNFAGDTWDNMKIKVDAAIEKYVVERVFEPVFDWVNYDWDHNRSVALNIYYGLNATVAHFVNNIPGVKWLNDNLDKLKRLVS